MTKGKLPTWMNRETFNWVLNAIFGAAIAAGVVTTKEDDKDQSGWNRKQQQQIDRIDRTQTWMLSKMGVPLEIALGVKDLPQPEDQKE